MVNAHHARLRKRRVAEVVTDDLPESTSDHDGAQSLAARDEMVRALARLPRRQRAVVVLRYWEDLTETQVAGVMGCSVGTVRSQAHRALAKLRVSPELTEAAAERDNVPCIPLDEVIERPKETADYYEPEDPDRVPYGAGGRSRRGPARASADRRSPGRRAPPDAALPAAGRDGCPGRRGGGDRCECVPPRRHTGSGSDLTGPGRDTGAVRISSGGVQRVRSKRQPKSRQRADRRHPHPDRDRHSGRLACTGAPRVSPRGEDSLLERRGGRGACG